MNCLSNDFNKVIKLYDSGKYTCVFCKNDMVFFSKEKGVKPLIDLIDDEKDYNGFSAADKIVGKAAAHLYILLNVSAVYGAVMSREAANMLSDHDVKISYKILTNSIINRKGDDICPIEKAVKEIDDSQDAYCKIKETLELLKNNKYGQC